MGASLMERGRACLDEDDGGGDGGVVLDHHDARLEAVQRVPHVVVVAVHVDRHEVEDLGQRRAHEQRVQAALALEGHQLVDAEHVGVAQVPPLQLAEAQRVGLEHHPAPFCVRPPYD